MPNKTVSPDAQTFVNMLNALLGDSRRQFSAMPGVKFDRIVITNNGNPSAYAFVGRTTGYVFKCAGWTTPAAGIRYHTVQEAALKADPYGSFLYAGAK